MYRREEFLKIVVNTVQTIDFHFIVNAYRRDTRYCRCALNDHGIHGCQTLMDKLYFRRRFFLGDSGLIDSHMAHSMCDFLLT